MSLHRYFKPVSDLPASSDAQLSPNIIKEVNKTLAATLHHVEDNYVQRQ